MWTVIIILSAVFLDFLLGEPRRRHPIAAFGRFANFIEQHFYPQPGRSAMHYRLAGGLAWMILVLPVVVLAFLVSDIPVIGIAMAIVLLYVTLGAQSLAEHARTVGMALQSGNLPYARERVGMMVSRDTRELDETGISRATIESVLENGNDAIFATIFWYLVLGLPGAVMYRLANTLDAMWGYRNERYLHFGWAAARLDDVLNWLPARLTALTYVLIGMAWQGLATWMMQARQWQSGNAGWVMACGAGAMQLKLGGPACYHGTQVVRPWLGQGRAPVANDIERSVRFVQQGLWLWLAIIFLGGWLGA